MLDLEQCEGVDDGAQHLAGDARIETLRGCDLLDVVEHAVFARSVDHRHAAGPLEVNDILDEPRALEEQLHEPAVDEVKALPNFGQVGDRVAGHFRIIAEDGDLSPRSLPLPAKNLCFAGPAR
jgi:hypothetical protein